MSNANLLEYRVAEAFYGHFPQLRPAQEAAIPAILDGQNVVLSSGTGSGKTEAVLAPLINRFWRHAINTNQLVILFITPTKALANDLAKRLEPRMDTLGLRIGIRHGDRDDLASGPTPHVLLTTPESLEVLMFRKDSALLGVRAVVIDEVHLLYNSQRGLQLSCLLKRLSGITTKLQWAALSATVGRLAHVRDFLFGSAEPAVFLEYPAHRRIDGHLRACRGEPDFLRLIQRIVADRPTKLLVFANARRECERLVGVLQQDQQLRQSVFTHYSSLSPEVRVETERQFAGSRCAICIATSTLELGIDIGDIEAVVLWGVPNGVESFLQRIGRGNRRSSKTNVICVVPDTSESVVLDSIRFLALLEAARKGEMPVRAPFELFGAVGQQCLGVIAANKGAFTRIADLCTIFSHTSHLQRPVVESVLGELATRGYLQRHQFKNQYGAADGLYGILDLKLIYGNFPLGSQSVDVAHGSQVLGRVPSANLLRLQRGATVRFGGRSWRVCEATTDAIRVEPAPGRGHAVDFTYPGAGVGFGAFLADRMWRLLHSPSIQLDIVGSGLRQILDGVVRNFREACKPDQIPFHRTSTGIRYFTFAGRMANKAIALATNQADYKAEDFYVEVISPIDWSRISTKPAEYREVFHALFEATSAQSLYQTFLPDELQRLEYLQEWLRSEEVERVLSRLKGSTPVKIDVLQNGLFAAIHPSRERQ